MPATYSFKNATVNADGPHNDVFTFQLVLVEKHGEEVTKTESFYQRRNDGWYFLYESAWYPTKSVPNQVRTARVKYGAGDIPQGRR